MRVIAVVIAVGGIPVASARASPLLTLGSRAFQERAHGIGIGDVRPSRFSVGGFPVFDKLQWRGWGADVTLAEGENLPDGPSTSPPARVQLRAYHVGWCDGSRAYRKVKWRARTSQGWTVWHALDPQTVNPSAGSADGTLCLSDAGPPPRTLRAAPLPIAATTHRRFTAAVALFTYPLSHDVFAHDFSANINWGDGSTSPGHARDAPNGLLTRLLERLTHRGIYFVDGTHTYTSTRTRTVHIVVRKGHLKTPELVTHATVEPLDPIAFFYLNPDNPTNGDVALVVPQRPGPLQRPIRSYFWSFNDGLPVIDDKSTRPLYKQALDTLARDPGNPIGLGLAHRLGILPPLVDDAGTVSQMVSVWRQYFLPYHIVPHIYPNAGQAAVSLKVVDAAGHPSQPFSMPVTVSDHCLEWGGPLAGLFGHATTCETAAGLSAVVHGPSRRPDYYAFDVSGGAGVSAGFTVVVSHSRDVSIAVHAAVGPHVKTPNPTEVSVAAGFVGPPSGPYPSDELIDAFGASAVIPVQATLGPFDMTLIFSPRCGCAGEEYGVRGWEGGGVSLGVSCSIDLGEIPAFSDLAPADHGPWPFQGGRVPQMSTTQAREVVSRGLRALTTARLQC
jgi:hypothetical protein